MLKRIVAAAVLALTAAPALASDVKGDPDSRSSQIVTGWTKPAARFSYQAPPSEGAVSDQRAQQEKQSTEKMACSCPRSEKREASTAPAR
jgi:hypothetical protein